MATGKSIQTFDIMDVSGGCNYSDDINALKKNQSPDSINVEFINGRIAKRPGERALTAAPVLPAGASTSSSVLVVAGGGGGAANSGGGGAGGGFLEGTYVIAAGATVDVVVGAGGTGATLSANGASGGNSSFGSAVALGGGGGATSIAIDGGSGGGAGANGTATGGLSLQGNSGGLTGYGFDGGDSLISGGYWAGGGGGAGSVGVDGVVGTAGNGGNGRASSISGASVTYAGGGGGSTYTAGTQGVGGTGGGTDGKYDTSASNAAANTGSGGGGVGNPLGVALKAGDGGSGIVIVSYTTPALDNGTGGTKTHSGGNTIHTFTSSGTFTSPSTVSTTYTGFSLIDFSDTLDRHKQIAHIGSGVFSYDRLQDVYDTIRTGTPEVRSYNAKINSYLIQTYEDYSVPYYWDGSSASMALVSSNAPGFKRSIEFQGYLLGMNTSANPMRVYYQPTSNMIGGGAAYTDYFTLTPAPNDDEISDAFLLNGRLYAGSKNSIFRISFVGGVTVFEFKQVISDIGIVPNTAQTVVTKEFGQVVLFLGTDKRVYLFDGANIKAVSDLFFYHNRTTPISLDLIDDAYLENSFAVYDFVQRIYRLVVTKKTSTTNYYCLNIDIDTFAYYPFDNMEFSAGSMCYDDLLRPSLIFLDYNGLLHRMFVDNPTDNGTAINEYYTSPIVSKSGSLIKKGVSINLQMVPTSNANILVYDRCDYTRAWQYRQSISLASGRDKFLGRSFVLGSSVLGSEKDVIDPQIAMNNTFNTYQFKLYSDTPTAVPWEIYDIGIDQENLKWGKAEAQR